MPANILCWDLVFRPDLHHAALCLHPKLGISRREPPRLIWSHAQSERHEQGRAKTIGKTNQNEVWRLSGWLAPNNIAAGAADGGEVGGDGSIQNSEGLPRFQLGVEASKSMHRPWKPTIAELYAIHDGAA